MKGIIEKRKLLNRTRNKIRKIIFSLYLLTVKKINHLILSLVLLSCSSGETPDNEKSENKDTGKKQNLVTADGKGAMLFLTDRPPNLETPLRYFLYDYTPNSVFFVRWHLSELPKEILIDTFRLRINGNVKTELSLSLEDLKTKFTPYTVTALCCCAGNARSFCEPNVPGAQWKNGAMGNAKWTGVKLKDILEKAGLKSGSVCVSFNGMDSPPLSGTPDFVKSLDINHCNDGKVMIAYEMNGESLPMLNGYPLKLVVPGWYATYWVGMLNEIKVYTEPYKGFWMEKAYLIPKGKKDANENHDSLSKDMEPINKIGVRSLFVTPEPDSILKTGIDYEIQGIAFDGGDGIAKVEISMDGGKTWTVTKLDAEIGKYSWRRWRHKFTANAKGEYTFLVKATNVKGETQPAHHWNRSGYMRNEIESLTVKVQ